MKTFDHQVQKLISQVLEQQSISVAYRRGVSAAARLHGYAVDPKDSAVLAGYPTHSQEHRVYVEGFVDTLQDWHISAGETVN